MHLEQLQAILEVAATRSITTAAKNLSTTQPSLSRTIKAFENDLELVLFDRLPDGVKLTSEGRALLPLIQQIVNDVNQLHEEAFYITSGMCSASVSSETYLRLLTTPIILDVLLSPASNEITRAFPNLKLLISQSDNQNGPASLPLAQYDLFIGSNISSSQIFDREVQKALTEQHLQYQSLFVEDFWLIMRHDHPLAHCKTLGLEEIGQYSFILHDYISSQMFCSQDPHLKLTVQFRSNNPYAVINTLMHTTNLFITTDTFSKNDYAQNEDLTIIPMRDLQIEYFCLFPQQSAKYCSIQEIISMLKFIHTQLIH